MEKIKLDIQKFSGGSYNYIYSSLEMECANRMYDMEMNDLIADLIPVLKELEWWCSCDSSEEDYREAVAKFKKKWFGTSRNKRLKEYIDRRIEKVKKETYDLIGEDYEKRNSKSDR